MVNSLFLELLVYVVSLQILTVINICFNIYIKDLSEGLNKIMFVSTSTEVLSIWQYF